MRMPRTLRTPSERPCSAPAVRRGLDQVAVRPHAGVLGEVGRVEARAVRVAEEGRAGRDGNGLAQTSSPISESDRQSAPSDADVEAEAPALRLAAMDGQDRVAEDEAADDVGAARDRLQRHAA